MTFLPAQKDSLARSSLDRIQADVVALGAVGDGVTDDQTVLQSAINTYKRIYFPDGDYLISSPLEITNPIEIILHPFAKIIAVNGMDDTLIAIHGTQYVTIRGGVFDGNSANQTWTDGVTSPCGITCTDSNHISLFDLTVQNCAFQGIQFTSYIKATASILNGQDGEVQDIVIDGCKILDIQNGSLLLQGGGNGTTDSRRGRVSRCYLKTNVAVPDGGTDGINVIDGFQDAIIEGCWVETNGSACIALEAHARPNVRDTRGVTVSGCNLRNLGNGGACVSASHSNNSIRDILITGCNMYKESTGGACVDVSETDLIVENWSIVGGYLECSVEASDASMSFNLLTTAGNSGRVKNFLVSGVVANEGSYFARIENLSADSEVKFLGCSGTDMSRGVRIINSDNVYFSDASFNGISVGYVFLIEGSDGCSLRGVNFKSCTVDNVQAENSNNLTLSNLKNDTAVGNVIELQDSIGVAIRNVCGITNDAGILIYSTSAVSEIFITGCEIETLANGDRGIFVNINGGTADQILIKDNVVKGLSAIDKRIEVVAGVTNVIMSDNFPLPIIE